MAKKRDSLHLARSTGSHSPHGESRRTLTGSRYRMVKALLGTSLFAYEEPVSISHQPRWSRARRTRTCTKVRVTRVWSWVISLRKSTLAKAEAELRAFKTHRDLASMRRLRKEAEKGDPRPSSIHYLSGASYTRVLAFCAAESNRSISHEQSDNSFSLSTRSFTRVIRAITRIAAKIPAACQRSRPSATTSSSRSGIVTASFRRESSWRIEAASARWRKDIFKVPFINTRARFSRERTLSQLEIEAARARWKRPSRVSQKNCFRSGPHRDDSCPFRIIRSRLSHGRTFAASSFFVPWILKRRLIVPRVGNLRCPFSRYRDAGRNKKDRSRYRSFYLSKDDSERYIVYARSMILRRDVSIVKYFNN